MTAAITRSSSASATRGSRSAICRAAAISKSTAYSNHSSPTFEPEGPTLTGGLVAVADVQPVLAAQDGVALGDEALDEPCGFGQRHRPAVVARLVARHRGAAGPTGAWMLTRTPSRPGSAAIESALPGWVSARGGEAGVRSSRRHGRGSGHHSPTPACRSCGACATSASGAERDRAPPGSSGQLRRTARRLPCGTRTPKTAKRGPHGAIVEATTLHVNLDMSNRARLL